MRYVLYSEDSQILILALMTEYSEVSSGLSQSIQEHVGVGY